MDLPDIRSRADIDGLVGAFYHRALGDRVIGHFFTSVVRLDLATHLPVIAGFWERILLNSGDYQGNPMLKHLDLARRSPLTATHLHRWLALWELSVRERFAGPVAELAIERAAGIGRLMLVKIERMGPPTPP